jgi:UDP-GlcNAc:undecaprenyl-phosphate GlcNAc-1-phosphate transferase
MFLPLMLFAVGGAAITLLVIPWLQNHSRFLNGGEVLQFHHSHKVKKSRFGGLALAGAFVALSMAAGFFFPFDPTERRTAWVIFSSSVAMFLLGFWDDIRPLGARKKLLLQIVIAFFAWYGGIQIEILKNPFNQNALQLGTYSCAVTILWLITMPNLINLIDGIDGLAGGIALMLMALLAYVGTSGRGGLFPVLCTAGMVGAILEFLRFNFPPAQIYMGDGGAYFLGFLVAELSIVNSNKGTVAAALLAPLFVLALPILDVALAVTRRGVRGLPIFRPDRRHIHHKLLGLGYTPRRAVLTLYLVTLISLIFGMVVFWSQGRWASVLLGAGVLAFILSARWVTFSREWFAVGRVLGSSETRDSIQYALTLERWFGMEAKNCDSMENLWSDFQFLLLKMNFACANLTMADGRREWKRADAPEPLAPLWQGCFEFSAAEPFCLELATERDTLDLSLFDDLSEIAAEAWHKAVVDWCARHRLPMCLKSRADLTITRKARQIGRAYVPLAGYCASFPVRPAAIIQPLE